MPTRTRQSSRQKVAKSMGKEKAPPWSQRPCPLQQEAQGPSRHSSLRRRQARPVRQGCDSRRVAQSHRRVRRKPGVDRAGRAQCQHRRAGRRDRDRRGCRQSPGAMNMDEEIRRFDWKVEAGAEYVVTQPVFDLDLLETFLKRIAHVKIPVICGIWPLTSYRNAEFMVNELRVPVPEYFMERMRGVDNAEKAREEGVNIAREMVTRVRGMVQGVQLSAPFGRYQMALDVAEAIGPR